MLPGQRNEYSGETAAHVEQPGRSNQTRASVITLI